jgi:hypothetical protein
MQVATGGHGEVLTAYISVVPVRETRQIVFCLPTCQGATFYLINQHVRSNLYITKIFNVIINYDLISNQNHQEKVCYFMAILTILVNR